MFYRIASLLFPPKCLLCRRLLDKDETDLCRRCRTEAPEVGKTKNKLSFLAGWAALWYYKENVRQSLLRYKFHNARGYAPIYGRLLAMKLTKQWPDGFDILTWIPISRRRHIKRGFDQVELLARAVGKELGIEPVRTLRKIRHNPPQSTIIGEAQRKANVLGAYRAVNPASLSDKRILLLDDILTTGATASECARVLLTAGAKEVYFAAVATANSDKKNSR